jgi:hypothetical protein
MIEFAVVLRSAIPRIVKYVHLAADKCIAKQTSITIAISVMKYLWVRGKMFELLRHLRGQRRSWLL